MVVFEFTRTYPFNDPKYFSMCKNLKKRGVKFRSDYISYEKDVITIVAYNVSFKHLKFLRNLNFKEKRII